MHTLGLNHFFKYNFVQELENSKSQKKTSKTDIYYSKISYENVLSHPHCRTPSPE